MNYLKQCQAWVIAIIAIAGIFIANDKLAVAIILLILAVDDIRKLKVNLASLIPLTALVVKMLIDSGSLGSIQAGFLLPLTLYVVQVIFMAITGSNQLLGTGDILLLAPLSALLSRVWVGFIILALLIHLVVMLVYLVITKARGKEVGALPFVPSLTLSAIICLIVG